MFKQNKLFLKVLFLVSIIFLPSVFAACINPVGGEYINADTIICPGTHGLSASMTVNHSDITIECNNSVLNSAGAPTGFASGFNNVTIKNCVFTNFNRAIDLSSNFDEKIVNNTFLNIGSDAIYLSGASRVWVEGNRISNGSSRGVLISYTSKNNTFVNNRFFNNDEHIRIVGNNSVFVNNTFEGSSTYAIRLISRPNNNLFLNNTITGANTGVILSTTFAGEGQNNSFHYNNIYNNLVNLNNTLAETVNATSNYWGSDDCAAINNSITQTGQVYWQPFLNNFYGVGANTFCPSCTAPADGSNVNSNVTYCGGTYNIPNGISATGSGITITCIGTVLKGDGTKIGFTVNNRNSVTIKGCTLQNYTTGIYLTKTQFDNVTGNTIRYASVAGVRMQTNAKNNAVEDNRIYNSTDGVLIASNCDYNNLTKNTIAGSSANCVYLNWPTGTNLNKNYVDGCGVGVRIEKSKTNSVTSNTVKNAGQGIYVTGASDDNSFSNNTITANAEGVLIDSAVTGANFSANNIHLNTVNFNNAQANTVLAENSWWGTTNETLIASKIIQNTGLVDYCPFLNGLVGAGSSVLCNVAPNITSTSCPAAINEGEWLNVSFTAEDANSNLDGYFIYRNGTVVAATNVSSWLTSYSDSGNYNYSFFVNDSLGLNDSDSCLVQVNDIACVENWVAQYGECLPNSTKLKYYVDSNNCGTTSTLPADNATYAACSYFNGTLVSGCQDITGAGTYGLENDAVRNLSNHYCFGIMADNVTLDCRGHTIFGNWREVGVSAYNRKGITVKNCRIEKFQTAIAFRFTNNSMITGNEIKFNKKEGINLFYSSNNTISFNEISSNMLKGVYVDHSDNNTIENNSILNNQNEGIAAYFSKGVVIDSNQICYSGYYDVDTANERQITGSANTCGKIRSQYVTCGSSCPALASNAVTRCGVTITKDSILPYDLIPNGDGVCVTMGANNIKLDCQGFEMTGTKALLDSEGIVDNPGSSGGAGVYVNGKNDVKIKNCVITNFMHGVSLPSGKRTNIINNTINQNTENGISISGQGYYVIKYNNSAYLDNHYVANNTIDKNGKHAINMHGGAGCNISGNNLSSNGYYGMNLESYSINNTISFNTMNSNKQHGIYITTVASDNNYLYKNSVNNNGASGINLRADGTKLEENQACGSAIGSDIIAYYATNTVGDNNACGTTYYYNDASSASGCASYCPGPSECGQKIYGNTVLTQDLSNTGNGICLSIARNYSVLDCNYHLLSGDSNLGTGIYLENLINTTLMNCNVTGFNYGIHLRNANNSNLTNNNLYANIVNLFVDPSFFNVFIQNTIRNALSIGVLIEYGANNIFDWNNIYGNLINLNNSQQDGASVSARNVFWGTVDNAVIASKIVENPGLVDYYPYLNDTIENGGVAFEPKNNATGDENKGHGNDESGCDCDNPSVIKGKGKPECFKYCCQLDYFKGIQLCGLNQEAKKQAK